MDILFLLPATQPGQHSRIIWLITGIRLAGFCALLALFFWMSIMDIRRRLRRCYLLRFRMSLPRLFMVSVGSASTVFPAPAFSTGFSCRVFGRLWHIRGFRRFCMIYCLLLHLMRFSILCRNHGLRSRLRCHRRCGRILFLFSSFSCFRDSCLLFQYIGHFRRMYAEQFFICFHFRTNITELRIGDFPSSCSCA